MCKIIQMFQYAFFAFKRSGVRIPSSPPRIFKAFGDFVEGLFLSFLKIFLIICFSVGMFALPTKWKKLADRMISSGVAGKRSAGCPGLVIGLPDLRGSSLKLRL